MTESESPGNKKYRVFIPSSYYKDTLSQGNAMQPQNKNRTTLYLVYATPLNDGSVIEDTVAASNEDEAYQKARALYPRHQFDVTVYLQSADDD